MSRLALVRPSRIDVIVGTDGNIECLFLVSIEIADKNAEGAVGVFVPTFESPCDAGAGVLEWLERELARHLRSEGKRDHEEHEETKAHNAQSMTASYCAVIQGVNK